MASNQSAQAKALQLSGLKKDVHKSMLKTGEYHHLKNGTISSFEGDLPFIQNSPSNIACVDLPEGFVIVGSIYIKEKNFHVLFLKHTSLDQSQIGYFHGESCNYEAIISQPCLNFSINHPIKGTYKYNNCELIIYFQDGYNRDRRINMDKPPYVKVQVGNSDCYENSSEFDCGQINIQNDLTPPVVTVTSVTESGALTSGAYQFAVAYANSNGDEQSSYYSMTNIVPIFEDKFGGYESTEGSNYNMPTDKSITLTLSNIDIKYNYVNIAVVKTTQGSPAYELIATVPISQREYTYTGKETTELIAFDKIVGLYPDYVNSKTITSANNYLIRANMSTEDEGNYQMLASLMKLEWVVEPLQADTFQGSYKNPLNTTYKLGYQRDEVVAFGVRFLLSNGRKTAVYHIPGRMADPSELVTYNKTNYPPAEACDFYEFQDLTDICEPQDEEIPHWKVYDTSSITEFVEPTRCDGSVIGFGEFQYWQSTDVYPCEPLVWGALAGQPIRHHKFPSASKLHIHSKPYDDLGNTYDPSAAFNNNNLYIYPMGVRLKKNAQYYVDQAKSLGLLPPQDLDLIVGYEIVRADRTNSRSVMANGLLYNMKYYYDKNPSTGVPDKIWYPNYPYNDLRPDVYLNDSIGNVTSGIDVSIPFALYTAPISITPALAPWNNPFPVTFTLGTTINPSLDFTVTYYVNNHSGTTYEAHFHFFGSDADVIDDFVLYAGDPLPSVTEPEYHEKSVFTFHSPDTSFKQPFLGSELRIHALEFGATKGWFEPVEGHPYFKPAMASDSCNYAIQFKSESNYNNYLTTPLGQRRRLLSDQGYFLGGNFVKFPNNTTTVNNRFRESSVGLKLTCEIEDPVITDESRYRPDCSCKAVVEDRVMDSKNAFTVDTSCTESYKKISSYYASVKRIFPNQYGQVNTVKYVSTGVYNNLLERKAIFGGDTFITRFTLKRKHGFFTVDYINQSAIGVNYKNKSNILTAKFFAVNEKGGLFGLREYVIDKNSSVLDCSISGSNRNGFFYLYSYGIPNFYTESFINTELRYSGANPWDTWYPKLQGTDVSKWTEQIRVNINLDNTYNYNFNYSKQNTESALFPQAADYTPANFCKNSHPGRIIYSKQSSQEESTDSWLINPANNYYDADTSLGAITDIQCLDSIRVLVRYENGTQIFNAFDTMKLEATTVSIDGGGMFAQKPQSFAETEVGYAGSTSKWAFDTTQFGSFFLDNDRGRVFQFVSTLEEISNSGMFNWFQENTRIKFFQDLDLLSNKTNFEKFNRDNPYFGIGYTSTYDNRFNIWFLTKKDYRIKDTKNLSDFSFSNDGTLLYKAKLANLDDTKVFTNVGWTISYSPIYKSWVSYHSFIPNYYLGGINEFHSGRLFDSTIWKHWDKFTFQTYYGVLYPFEIQVTTADEQKVSILRSIEYNLKVQKYVTNNYQDILEESVNFNKLIVSTDNQSSGLMNLILNDKTNPYLTMSTYPKVNANSLDVTYSKVEGHKYRVNQFADLVLDKNNNIPIFIHDENGVDRYVNNIDYTKVNNLMLGNQKFRSEFFDIMLIQDKERDYKMIFKFLVNKTLDSRR